jgi:transcriptional regulator with XRE-family HTH domain
VSLGYLSEVERGRKEASSELLASICDALGAPLSQVLREVSDGFALAELQNEPAFEIPREPALAGSAPVGKPGTDSAPADATASLRGAVRLQPAKAPAAPQRLVMPQRKLTVGNAQRLAAADPKLEPVTLPGTDDFDKLGRGLNDMVPV